MSDSTVQLYTYDEIEKIVGHPKVEVGRGGYGVVYQGSVLRPNGEQLVVAVKLPPAVPVEGKCTDKELQSLMNEIELA